MLAIRRRKLRVVFVIGDLTKWKGQLVYERMLASADFDPYVIPTAMDLGWIPESEQPKRVVACRQFLESRNIRCLPGMDMGERTYVPFSEYRPDIVIYQQPWGMPECQDPIAASEYALTFYMPYYIAAGVSLWQQHDAPLFRLLYASFVEGPEWVDYFHSVETVFRVGCRWIPCGCPIREEITSVSNVPRENLVIYAPHWSIPVEKIAPSGCSTFLWTGRAILEFAKAHPEIKWVIKPHPMLKYKLEESGLWSKKEIDDYFKEWECIGTVCESGTYFKEFHRSKAMITDCLSFLSEYLLLNRPLIRLENPGTVPENLPGSKKFAAMYRVQSNEEMLSTFENVLVQEKDPMREKRSRILHEMGWNENNISGQMLSIIRSVLMK